jgi:hypothetical protein
LTLIINEEIRISVDAAQENLNYANGYQTRGELRIDINNVKINFVKELIDGIEITDLRLFSNSGDELANYEGYQLFNLEQNIQHGIMIASMVFEYTGDTINI